MLSIENLFVMDPFIMETQNPYILEMRRLVDLGKQMNLARKELLEFVRAKQALARDEIIRIRQEKKEERMATIEDEARIAEEVERVRQHKKGYDEKIAAEAEKIRQLKSEEEEKVRQHKK